MPGFPLGLSDIEGHSWSHSNVFSPAILLIRYILCGEIVDHLVRKDVVHISRKDNSISYK